MLSKILRNVAVASAVLLSVTSLSGCAPSGQIQAGTEVSIGELHGLDSLNPDVATSLHAVAPNTDLGQLTSIGFYTRDSAAELVPNLAFGKASIVSTSPFTVAYTLTGAAKWSDGVKVDATDLLLSWQAAVGSEKYGFHSLRAGGGLRFATTVPKLSADLNTLTVQFSRPVNDWRTAIYPAVAAHTLAQQALGGSQLSGTEASSRLVQAINTANESDLGELAKAYVSAYSVLDGAKPEKSALIGAGPYLIQSANALTGVKLTANPAFNWGNAPRIETVNVRYYEDSIAMIADIQVGKLDLAATVESGAAQTQEVMALAQKADLRSAIGLSQNIETVQLNLRTGSIFVSSGSGDTRAAKLRQAFLLAVPKQRITDAINADYSVQSANSFFYSPDDVHYPAVTKRNDSSKYAIQNLETASELLKDAGVTHSIDVRVLFDSTNPLEQMVWGQLNQASKQFGFNLVNSGVTDPSGHVTAGDYDVLLSQLPLFGLNSCAATDSVDSSGFGSEDFDNAAKALAAAKKSSSKQALVAKLDAALFNAGFGLPLFQAPTMVAYSKSLGGVSLSPLGNSAVWGYWNWQKAAK